MFQTQQENSEYPHISQNLSFNCSNMPQQIIQGSIQPQLQMISTVVPVLSTFLPQQYSPGAEIQNQFKQVIQDCRNIQLEEVDPQKVEQNELTKQQLIYPVSQTSTQSYQDKLITVPLITKNPELIINQSNELQKPTNIQQLYQWRTELIITNPPYANDKIKVLLQKRKVSELNPKIEIHSSKTNLETSPQLKLQLDDASISTAEYSETNRKISSPFQNNYQIDKHYNSNNDNIKSSNKNNKIPWIQEFLNNKYVSKIIGINQFSSDSSIEYQQQEILDNLFQKKELDNLKFAYSEKGSNECRFNITAQFSNKRQEFFENIISFLSNTNLDLIHLPIKLRETIFDMVQGIKQCCRVFNKKRPQNYNKIHYFALFLRLKPKSIQQLALDEKNVIIHKMVFKFDLNKYTQDELDYVNFLKLTIFELIERYLQKPITNKQENMKDNQYEYRQRAYLGLQQMIDGRVVDRF